MAGEHRASSIEVAAIVDLFVASDESAGQASLGVLSVSDVNGSQWDFDTLQEFLDELSRDTFSRYQLSTRLGGPELSVSYTGYGLMIDVSLSAREPMQWFMDEVIDLARQGPAGLY